MAGMGNHSDAGAPARRAHFAAWSVFSVMAATSMTFQTYHAITVGRMAWPLAGLVGVVPLALSIGILEVAAVWGNLRAQAVAYLIAIGAMYESASATGAVTAHAGPAHAELVFGLILDAAALFAFAFINHGPTAAQAVAAVRDAHSAAEEAARNAAETEAALRAQLAGAQTAIEAAKTEAQTALRDAVLRAEDDAQTALETALEAAGETSRSRERALSEQIDAEHRAREIAEQGAARWTDAEDRRMAAEFAREASAGELRTTREALNAAIEARNDAETRAAEADAQAATLTRKLAATAGAKRTRKKAGAAGPAAAETTVPNDVDAQAEALAILAREPDISGAKLGPRVRKSERWGQLFLKQLAARPAGGGADAEEA
jgi:hypothetical protein